MRIKLFIIAWLLLLSAPSHAATTVPAAIFSEIQSAAEMQPGDIVYLDFWASWCSPCRKSFPWMNAMHQKYQPRGFKVLAVNVDKELAMAERFLASVPATFSIFYDPKGRLAKAFKIKGMPSSVMIDDQGRIQIAHTGFFKDKKPLYEQEIQSLLTR